MNLRAQMIAGAVVLAGLAGLTGVPAARAATDPKGIRKIDFRNFTYDGLDEDEKVTVVDGEFSRDDADGQLYVNVGDVDHGDLDGDGIEEAVVTIGMSTGGTGFFTDARVFRNVNGKAVWVTNAGMGDRADGGIDDVVIVGGVLRIERYAGDAGACCPNLVVRESWKLKGSKLVTAAPNFTRRLAQLGEDPAKISFLKGTSEAVIEGVGGTRGYFDAGKGQKVTLNIRSPYGGTATVRVTGPSLSKTLTLPATWATTLPATGRYTIEIPETGAEIQPSVRMTLTIK